MHLDIPTLTVMGCFVAACAGVVLLVGWSQNRRMSALAIWGLADIGTAVGIFFLILGSLLREPDWAFRGVVILAVTPGAMWMAARTLDGKPAPLLLALLGGAIVVLTNDVSPTRQIGGSLGFAAASIYLLAAALSLWLGRMERLAARAPLIILMAVHAAVLLLGTYSVASGSLAEGAVPPVASLFGIVHFENIVFLFGTAVFLLAL